MADFFSTLTDAFTGAPLQQSSQDIQTALANLRSQVQNVANNTAVAGGNALTGGQTNAINALNRGYGQAQGDVLAALAPQLAALYGGQGAGAGALTSGQDQALAALRAGVAGAGGAYQPLYNAAVNYGNYGDNAAQMYADAQGLNGPAGTARAQAAFQASPGYQYQVGQATDAATRAANIAGGALGGNTLAAVTQLAGNLANQDYTNWLGRTLQQAQLYSPLQANALSAYGSGTGNAALTGGTGAANIYTGTGTGLAGLYSGTGQNVANVYGGTGRSLADLATGGAGAQSNVFTGTGQNIAALLSSLAGQQIGNINQTVNPTAQAIENAGMGQMLGSQNLWGALINAGKGIASLPAGTLSNLIPFNVLPPSSGSGTQGLGGWTNA